MQEANQVKKQKLSQAAAHVNEVISTCRPVFRHLSLSALQACDWSSMAQLPHLPAKLQALYYQVASASVLETVPAQVSHLNCNLNCSTRIYLFTSLIPKSSTTA